VDIHRPWFIKKLKKFGLRDPDYVAGKFVAAPGDVAVAYCSYLAKISEVATSPNPHERRGEIEQAQKEIAALLQYYKIPGRRYLLTRSPGEKRKPRLRIRQNRKKFFRFSEGPAWVSGLPFWFRCWECQRLWDSGRRGEAKKMSHQLGYRPQ